MTSRELIAQTARRMTFIRRVNLAFVILSCALLLIAVYALTTQLRFPKSLAIVLVVLALTFVGVILRSSRAFFRGATERDAALFLDSQLNAKDRFSTVATISEQADPRVELIAKQADKLAPSFDPIKGLPLRLKRVAKWCLGVMAPLCLAILIYLGTRVPEKIQLASLGINSAEVAENLREMVEQAPALPESLREEIGNIADQLEEGVVEQDALIEDIEEALDKISEVESIAGDSEAQQALSRGVMSSVPESNDLVPPSPPPNKQEGQEASTETGYTTSEQTVFEETGEKVWERTTEENKQGEIVEQSSGSNADQLPGLESNSSGGAGATQSGEGNSSASGVGKGGEEKGSQTSSGGDPKTLMPSSAESEGQKEKMKSESGEKGASSPEEKDQAAVKKKEEEEKEEAKKSTVGLGDGNPQSGGKEGLKDSQASATPGQSESGEKGDAQNKDQGKSGEQGEKSKADSQGKKEAKGDASKGQQDSESKEKGAGKLKEELKELRDKVSQEPGSDSPKNSQSTEKPQPQKETETQTAQGKQGQQGQAPQQGEKSGQTKKGSGSEGQEKNKEGGKDEAKGDDKSDKGGGKDSAKEGGPATEESQDKAPPQESGQAKQPQKSGTEAGNADKLANTGLQKDLTAPPTATTEKPNPFGEEEADGGAGVDTSDVQKTGVEVPLENKVVIRTLGSELKEVYKNTKEARPKTALGAAELQKPEAETGSEKQRIPLEYRDLLSPAPN